MVHPSCPLHPWQIQVCSDTVCLNARSTPSKLSEFQQALDSRTLKTRNTCRWLDRTLIRVASYFGEYTPNDPRSFDLHPNMALLPQFLFNLRRSHFVQVLASCFLVVLIIISPREFVAHAAAGEIWGASELRLG